jgi:recombinational DNA repair protein (RecF pathway)
LAPHSSHSQLINLTYYEKENQELVSFRQVEILKSRFNLSSNAALLTGFSYMGDLLIDFSPPHQANDNLFRMAIACFEAASEDAGRSGCSASVLRGVVIEARRISAGLADVR